LMNNHKDQKCNHQQESQDKVYPFRFHSKNNHVRISAKNLQRAGEDLKIAACEHVYYEVIGIA
jgi:hypothetical protein